MALDVFGYTVKRYVGAYIAAMNGIDNKKKCPLMQDIFLIRNLFFAINVIRFFSYSTDENSDKSNGSDEVSDEEEFDSSNDRIKSPLRLFAWRKYP